MFSLFRQVQPGLNRSLRRSVELDRTLQYSCFAEGRAEWRSPSRSPVAAAGVQRFVERFQPSFTLLIPDGCDHKEIPCACSRNVGDASAFCFIARMFFGLMIEK